MKKNFTVCVLIFSGCLLAAPYKTLPGLEGGMLKISGPASSSSNEKPAGEPKIRKDDRNINRSGTVDPAFGKETANRRKKWSVMTPIPPDSMAAKITVSGRKRIVWAPMTYSGGGMQTVRLPSAEISADQSVLAIVETTGQTDGPNGSRIILLNTHNWEVARLIETERKIGKIIFPPGESCSAYAVCARQSSMKQPYGVAEFDLISGKEKSFIPLNGTSSITGILCDFEGRLFITDPVKARIRVYSRDGILLSSLRISSPEAVLALSPDGKKLAAAGRKGKIEIFKITDLRPTDSVSIPENFPAVQLIFLNNEKDFLCAPDPLSNQSAFAIRKGRIFDLSGFSSGYLALSMDGETILNLKSVKHEIEYVDAGPLRHISSVMPEEITPRTRGDIRFIRQLEASGITVVLDDAGNLYALYLPENEKRYQKEIIISPWK